MFFIEFNPRFSDLTAHCSSTWHGGPQLYLAWWSSAVTAMVVLSQPVSLARCARVLTQTEGDILGQLITQTTLADDTWGLPIL